MIKEHRKESDLAELLLKATVVQKIERQIDRFVRAKTSAATKVCVFGKQGDSASLRFLIATNNNSATQNNGAGTNSERL